MTNKDEEQVLCIEPEFLPLAKHLNGVQTLSVDEAENIYDIISENAIWMRRGDVENDPAIKQIIPYTLVINNSDILAYKRLSGSGEQRLVDLHSIGFGGHITKLPQYEDFTMNHIIEDSIARELDEEIGLGHYSGPFVKGILYAGRSNKLVDQVHVGLVNIVSAMKSVQRSNEKDVLTDPVLVNLWSLRKYWKDHKFETWSNMVIMWLTSDPIMKDFVDTVVNHA